MTVSRAGLLLVGLAAFTACTPSPTLSIRLIGSAAFELTDGRTTLLVDFPYESGSGGFMTFDSAAVAFGAFRVARIPERHVRHADVENVAFLITWRGRWRRGRASRCGRRGERRW